LNRRGEIPDEMPDETHLDRNNKLKEIDNKSSSSPSGSKVDNTHIYQIQTILNLYKSGIAPEIISLQLDVKLEEVNKII
jgi:hypothetical protein